MVSHLLEMVSRPLRLQVWLLRPCSDRLWLMREWPTGCRGEGGPGSGGGGGWGQAMWHMREGGWRRSHGLCSGAGAGAPRTWCLLSHAVVCCVSVTSIRRQRGRTPGRPCCPRWASRHLPAPLCSRAWWPRPQVSETPPSQHAHRGLARVWLCRRWSLRNLLRKLERGWPFIPSGFLCGPCLFTKLCFVQAFFSL